MLLKILLSNILRKELVMSKASSFTYHIYGV